MPDPFSTPDYTPTLREHFVRAIRESNRKRPMSFYLLFAILVVVLLGSQFVHVTEDPKRFALFLSLNFVFFFVVACRAIVDFFEILRGHFRESKELYTSTLGDDEFVKTLGEAVERGREE